MTIGSILLALALIIIVGIFIARPFILPRQRPPRLTERQALLAQKDALLAQIKALDFDAETGKELPEYYQLEREALVKRAAGVLQRLDESVNVDHEIEAAVSDLRQRLHQPSPQGANFCANCGQPVEPTDNFCTSCGQALKPSSPSLSGESA